MKPAPLTLAASSGARASNLAFALGCLPRERLRDALIFYGFCREVDDIADDPGRSAAEKKVLLDTWQSALTDRGELLPPEFAALIERRQLDRSLLVEIIRGVAMDIEPARFATFEDLQAYCWRVAGAVGLVSIDIFGCIRPESRQYAEQLGYALQLTNILRDVAEDARSGRVYLPIEDTEKFGVRLVSGESTGGDFSGLMAFEAARARSFFARTRPLVHPADATALAPAEMMRQIYEKLLTKMEADGFRVFARRYRVGKWEKLLILARTRLRGFLPPATASG